MQLFERRKVERRRVVHEHKAAVERVRNALVHNGAVLLDERQRCAKNAFRCDTPHRRRRRTKAAGRRERESVEVVLLLRRRPARLEQLRRLVRVDKAARFFSITPRPKPCKTQRKSALPVKPLLLQEIANALEKLLDRIHGAEPVDGVAEALERDRVVKRIANDRAQTLAS